MECCLKISPSMNFLPLDVKSCKHLIRESMCCGLKRTNGSHFKIVATISDNGHPSASQLSSSSRLRDMHRKLSSVESRFCYDKPIPEEIIESPVGLSLGEKSIGNKTRCPDCEAKGAILCVTCSGSGLYVDSIMESQGIIVKVRCLGCGGTGNIMCSECGGRGHHGLA